MTYKIEKRIPLPPNAASSIKKYPFDKLEIGDSFFVPLQNGKSPSGLFASISQAKKRLNINLFSAKVKGGHRVWRIEMTLPRPDGKA